MTRLLLGLAAVAAVGTAVAVSRPKPPAAGAADSPLQIATSEKNPWTSLKLNNSPEQFQFAVVSDRTGGHRAKVFSKAVHQINLMQPEFVMSVGDLIEGYTKDKEKAAKEWDEFDAFTKKLDMPFFYVPGNHDLANQAQVELWGGRYGKTHYHFVYRNTLFVAINSEDTKGGNVTPEQVAAVKSALDQNPDVRWTLVFVHKPLWTHPDLKTNGWAAVEKVLEGRRYTVFCGHVHKYQKYVRNGMNYYQLATTGGGSKLRGLGYGEFDHLTWITMKADGPLIANVMLDGILPEDLRLPETQEGEASEYTLLKGVELHPTVVKVLLDGKPVSGAAVTFHGAPLPGIKEREIADGLTGKEGTVVLSTVKAGDGVPAGSYRVTVFKTKKGGYYDLETSDEASVLPAKYTKKDTSGLTAQVVAGKNEITVELTK